MKKMLLATALALLITGCSTDVYCSKQTGSSSTKETITHHFFVSGIGQKKTVDAVKFVAAQKMLLNRNPANTRKWIAGFITLGIYTRWKQACIAHNNCMSCPSIWATLSALLINILLGSFQLFLLVISLSEGEIILFSGVCQSGGGCIIHAGGGGGFTH